MRAERNEEIKSKRLDLPWVPVEKEYEFDTEDGKKTLAELFDGRSQLLAYNIMFGPDYTLGAVFRWRESGIGCAVRLHGSEPPLGAGHLPHFTHCGRRDDAGAGSDGVASCAGALCARKKSATIGVM